MLKERHQVFVSMLVAADAIVILAAQLVTFILSQWWRADTSFVWSIPNLIAPIAIGLLLLFVAMTVVGVYKPRRDRAYRSELFDLFKAILLAWGLYAIAVLLIQPEMLQQSGAVLQVKIFPVAPMVLLVLQRFVFRMGLYRLRRKGWNQRHYAVIGTGRLGQNAFHTFLRNRWTGIQCSYFISHHDTTRRKECLSAPVRGGLDDLEETLDKSRLDGVVIALPQSRSYLLPNIMMRLERFSMDVRIIPDISPRYMPINLSVHELDGMPILTMRQSPLQGFAAVYKRVIDVIVSLIAIVVFGIPMAMIALLIRLESNGPAIFRQERVSVGRHRFSIFKFRTMYAAGNAQVGESNSPNANQEKANGQDAWTKRDDPRITRIGKFLRNTSLDELPQLLNVLLGDMSLVGPRPERVDLIEDFRKDWRGYMLRQNIKPGMTGWAQVNGLRGDTSLRKRLQYDLYYIRNWSLTFDLRILVLTVFKGFRHPNAH